jgi:hypothetical protein
LAGQGTMALEIVNEVPDVDAVKKLILFFIKKSNSLVKKLK